MRVYYDGNCVFLIALFDLDKGKLKYSVGANMYKYKLTYVNQKIEIIEKFFESSKFVINKKSMMRNETMKSEIRKALGLKFVAGQKIIDWKRLKIELVE
jgi:hypothetical protein